MYNFHELGTTAKHKLKIIYVIFQDKKYGMVWHGENNLGVKSYGADDLPEVDFCKIAEGYNINSHYIKSMSDLKNFNLDNLSEDQFPMVMVLNIDSNIKPFLGSRIDAVLSKK